MIELYQHQETALSLLRLNDGFALFMEQGTGKTFPVLFRLAELAKTKRINSALIVAPKAVCESWSDKIKLLSPSQQHDLSQIDLDIVSYDLVWRRDEFAKGTFDAVVLDESHFIKTHTAKRTQGCLKICSRAKYRYILTGTPTSNGQLCNLWSQFAAITPVIEKDRIYPKCFDGISYWQWIRKVARLDKYFQPIEYTKVREIQEVMSEVSYRITKEECLDLPEKMPDELWRVKLPREATKPYKQMAHDSAILDLDTLADNPLTRSLRLRQIASGFLDTENDQHIEYKTEKLTVLEEYLKEREGKTVIFCDFRHSIDAVSQMLTKNKIKHVILDGRQRNKGIWRDFQDKPSIKVIICQYQSGSAGIDLYAADTCVFYEPTLSSNLNEQAKDRIHRVGQDKACSYIYLIARGTIEQAIYTALSNYSDFNEALFTRYLDSYRKGERL